MQPTTVHLGTVKAPSGTLLIIDKAFLRVWAHDRPPILPEGVMDRPELTARANCSVDLEIQGRDAEAAGRRLDRQWHPRFLYDIPADGVEETTRKLEEIARSHHLDARVQVLAERVTHRCRADFALAQGHGAGEVQVHGFWCGVVTDVPRSELRVEGERMPEGDPDRGRLRRVVIPMRTGSVAASERFAQVMVDEAGLLAVDLDAAVLWKADEPLDGKGDFAFWGRDAEEVAGRLGAVPLDEGAFGWRDLPIQQAAARAQHVTDLRRREGKKFATDFRPHSHLYRLMEQVRSSETGSGVVQLGDAMACGFMTTWGDGIFEVHRDFDVDGRLLRIRFELGTDDRRRLMRRLELRWNTSAIVSRQIVDDGQPVRFLYREAADRAQDSGWRMLSGRENKAYTLDAKNMAIVPLSEFARRDKRVDGLLDEPVGSVFERKRADDDFVRVTDWHPSGE